VLDDPSEECEGSTWRSDPVGKACKDIANDMPAWPFGNTVNYLSGTLKCSSGRLIDRTQCTPFPGCYVGGGVHVPATLHCY